MRLGVYSLQAVLFEGEAREVVCNTKAGEIAILDHHEPLIGVLAEGTMKIIGTDGQDHYIPVSSGFLEVKAGGEVKILVERQENPEK